METKVNYTIVGLFVITLILAIVFTVIWLGAGIDHKSYAIYEVFMNESVTGLSIDAPVKYNGVDIGSVKKISLNPKRPQQVDLLLNIQQGTPITVSTRAVLTTQGLTGVAYIDLQTKGKSTAPLVKGPDEEYPVILSSPSLLLRLDKAVSDLTTNLSSLSQSIQSAFDEENRQALKEILANINRVSGALARNEKRFDIIMENAALASKKFPALMQSGETMLASGKTAFGNLNTQTIPHINEILGNVQIVSSNLVDVSQNVKQNPSILLRGTLPNKMGPGE